MSYELRLTKTAKDADALLTSRGVVKLADLGLARAMTDMQAAKAEAGTWWRAAATRAS
jgi:hypothetical protein